MISRRPVVIRRRPVIRSVLRFIPGTAVGRAVAAFSPLMIPKGICTAGGEKAHHHNYCEKTDTLNQYRVIFFHDSPPFALDNICLQKE